VPQGHNQYGFWTPDVYGGTGHDTFEIDYNYAASGFTAGEAEIHDFKPGTDHLEFKGGDATATLLPPDGDHWTIHDSDPNTADVSFTIDGVMHLDTSDYTFV
jgi:hypothetical protein